jgi:hypothetical protein
MQFPGAAIAIERLIEAAGDPRVGMEHQVLADQTAGVGKPIGEARGGGIGQKARRPDSIAGEETTSTGEPLVPP